MKRSSVILPVLVLLIAPPSFAKDEGAPGGKPKEESPFHAGVELEVYRSEIDLEISDLDGVDWQGDVITGKVASDPNDNADYATQRSYAGLKGVFAFAPVSDLSLQGFLRLGQVRDVFQSSLKEGSFFLDWGDKPESDVVSFVGSVYFGAGAGATYALDAFRIGLDVAFGTNSSVYNNQSWFGSRTDGSISILTFEAHVRAAYDFGFVVPRASFGLFLYSASGEFQEILKNNGRNSRYEANFEAITPLTLVLGADIPAGEQLNASVEVSLFGEYAVRIALGLRFL